MTAGENLVEGRIARVASARVFDQTLQLWRVAQHRREPIFGPCLRHVEGRLDHQHRGRVLGDMVANDIVENLGLADLGRGHNHDHLDRRVGECVHDSPLILGPTGQPLTGLRTRLWTEFAFPIRPVRDLEIRRWPECSQGLAD